VAIAAAPIAAEHAAGAAARLQLKLSGPHAVILALALGVAAALVWAGVRRSPGGGIQVPARATEDAVPFTPPRGVPMLGTFDHFGPVVISPHRYPAGCGGEISALINGGHETLRLPHSKDVTWITCPPSEAVL
jgi:hypothetical protein